MRIHHIAFRTNRLGELEEFYAGVLGLAVLRRGADVPPRSVWLDAGGSILMLEQRDEGEPELATGSKELIAFAVSPGMIERLAATGIGIEARTSFTVYVRDPDGRRIGLSSYPDELK